MSQYEKAARKILDSVDGMAVKATDEPQVLVLTALSYAVLDVAAAIRMTQPHTYVPKLYGCGCETVNGERTVKCEEHP